MFGIQNDKINSVRNLLGTETWIHSWYTRISNFQIFGISLSQKHTHFRNTFATATCLGSFQLQRFQWIGQQSAACTYTEMTLYDEQDSKRKSAQNGKTRSTVIEQYLSIPFNFRSMWNSRNWNFKLKVELNWGNNQSVRRNFQKFEIFIMIQMDSRKIKKFWFEWIFFESYRSSRM